MPIVVNAVSTRLLLQFAFSQSALCPVVFPHLVMSFAPPITSHVWCYQYQGACNMLGSMCQGSCCTMLHICLPQTHVWHEPKTCLIAKVKRKWGKGQTEGKRIAAIFALTTLGIYNIRKTLNQQRVLIKNTVCFLFFLLFALGTSFWEKDGWCPDTKFGS